MKLRTLTEAKYVTGTKLPTDIANQLVVLQMPPGLSLDQWHDYDHRSGYGGTDSVVLENPRVLVTTRDMANGYEELLLNAVAYFRDRDRDFNRN